MNDAKRKDANTEANDDWYLTAVLYEVDVENFLDSDGDGVGDFRGLISKLDYIRSLGVDCIWLQPFYATVNRDNGYDVTDYRTVDPRLGTMDDFDTLVREAKSRGLRVIADVPLNHTSDRHWWFKAARESRDSPYRAYYLWRDDLPANPAPYPVFGPEQGGNWEWDGAAGQYYFHTFYRFMPDLNIANPAVQKELFDIAQFWMRRGLSGFRLDAVPFLVQDRAEGEHLEDPHEFLRDLRSAIDEVSDDAVLMAEANLPPEHMRHYFGDGDQMHLLLNFYLCNHLFLSMADGQARHIIRAWEELHAVPKGCGWANFVRNHDELSLDQLTDEERETVFKAFGPTEDMQLYGRGIRRRLAPMVDGDLRRMKLTYALLISLPGTPVLNMGEELGLGDDLSLKDRNSARTPMQWHNSANAGFSTAPEEKLIRPVIKGGPFGYQQVNVEALGANEGSLLNFVRRAIAAYHDSPAFGKGDWAFIDTGEPTVLAHRCECPGDAIYAVHNLSSQVRTITLDLPPECDALLSDADYGPARDGKITLSPYGFRWFRTRTPRGTAGEKSS